MSSHSPKGAGVDARLAVAALGVVTIIIYGSLFPFHFVERVVAGGPLRALLTTWERTGDRSDNVSNFWLYLPLGLLLVRMARNSPRWITVPVAILAGFVLSMCMEMTQFYDPGRLPEMADVYANTAGTIAGALTAIIIRRDLTRPFAALLLTCWVGNRLFPYFLNVDFHTHLSAARPVPLEVFKQAVYWLAAAAILEAMLDVARSRLVLALMIAIVLIARLFLIAGSISTSEVLGAIVALGAWVVLANYERRTTIVASLFIVLVIVQALEPFQFQPASRPFGWIPFAGFMASPRETAVRVFFEKAFTYGALVWLWVRAGVPFPVSTTLGTALVLGLRMSQVYLPGRSAEVTDAVMVLMLAGTMWLLREAPASVASN
jgi:VanZ family protein